MNLDQYKNNLSGPVFSIITPFKKNGNIDYFSLKNYINYLYKRGATKFFVMVYNSRLSLLTEQEIIKLNLFCIKKVKKLNKKNIIICAEPYHTSTSQSIKYVNLFKKNGADIVSLIFGEKYYSDLQVFKHFQKVHNNTNCYLLLHQQILENGLSASKPFLYYSLELLKKISKLPKFVAMKEDAKNKNLTRMIGLNLSSKMVIITSGGGKQQWLFSRKYGCQSWLSGVSSLDPKIGTEFYEAYLKNNKIKINKIINLIEKPFFKCVKKYGWHLTIKSFLEHNKMFLRYERSPLMKLDNKNHKKILITLNKIKKSLRYHDLNHYLKN